MQIVRRNNIQITTDDLDYSLPTRRVLQICSKLKLICVDPTVTLRNKLGRRAFLEDDEHPSALAHDIIADELINHRDMILGLP